HDRDRVRKPEPAEDIEEPCRPPQPQGQDPTQAKETLSRGIVDHVKKGTHGVDFLTTSNCGNGCRSRPPERELLFRLRNPYFVEEQQLLDCCPKGLAVA
ncbi:unnamed protein product, partial [Amoebophrya sp. A25]